MRFIDPTGLEFIDTDPSGRQQGDYYDKEHPNRTTKLGASILSLADAGCYLATFTRIGNDLRAKQGLEPITLIQSNKLAKNSKLFSGNSGNLLTKDSGRSLVELMSGKIISEVTSVSNNIEETADKYNKSSSEFYGILKTEFNLNGDNGTHFMNLDDFVNEDFLVNDTSRRGRRTSADFRATERPARLDVYEVTGDGQISSSISSSPDNVNRNVPKTKETGLGK